MATRKTPVSLTTDEEREAQEQAKIDAAVEAALKRADRIIEMKNFRCMGCWTRAVEAPAKSDWRNVTCQDCASYGNVFTNSLDLLITRKLGSIGSQYIPNIAARIAKVSGYTIEQLIAYGEHEVVSIEELAVFFDKATAGMGGFHRAKTPNEQAVAEKIVQQQQARDKLRAKKGRIPALQTQIEQLTNQLTVLQDEIADLENSLGNDA